MAVSKRLRYEILRRDKFACRYCGAKAPDAPLRVDHVTPVALGGTDDPTNLVTSCEPCNAGKTSTIEGFVEDVQSDTVPPSPEVLCDEVERLWLAAYTSLYGGTEVTLQALDEVRSATREMYRIGAPAADLRRSATISGLKADTFIWLSETSDPEWLRMAAEAFRLWRTLWFRSTGHESYPDMDMVMLFECSVEQAINAGVDRFSILRASAAAGRAQGCFIEDHLDAAERARIEGDESATPSRSCDSREGV